MTNTHSIPDVWPELLAALEHVSKPYPAQAIALADAHREEVAPLLVAELERLAADPSRAPDDADYMLHLYAMFLLAWWRDPRGLQPLLALAHTRDPDLLDRLLGDHLFDGLGRCMGSMTRGDLSPLLALAHDRQAGPWGRTAALDAMRAGLLEGDVPRETVLAHWRDVGEREAAACRADGSESDFLASLVIHAMDLGASDLLPAIRGWFDEGLPNPDLITLQSVEEDISRPPEQCMQQLREGGNKGYIGTPEKEIAWWYCFKEEKPARSALDLKAFIPSPPERAAAFIPPPPVQPHVRESPKLGRNDPCHCGSGKKFKKCHGAT